MKIWNSIMVVLLVACNQDEVGQRKVSLDIPFQISENETVLINDPFPESPQSLIIQLLNISDSRCPSNVVCVWGGTANILLNITNTKETKDVQLCIGDCARFGGLPNEIEIIFGSDSYLIIFEALTPYPSDLSDLSSESRQFATLKLIRL